jgi:hypothetical protein
MKMVRKPEGEKGRTMNEQRCRLCGLWACEHIKRPLEARGVETVEPISLGESVGEKAFPKLVDARLTTVKNELLPKTEPPPARVRIADVPSTRLAKEEEDNTLYKTRSTIPMGPAPESAAQRVLIPPPPKVPTIAGPSSPITKVSDNEWVNCNICKARVNVKYLDAHQKMHIGTHSSTSRAIVPASSSATSSTGSITVYSSKNEKKDNSKPKLSPQEHYKFKHIEDACAASSMSQDGRYSDITVIYWMRDKPNVTTTYYAGGSSSSTYNVGERLSIHVVYDSLEDYYTVTTKLLKRSSYSSWDTEENVPDRICGSPRELLEEIKRALLFFCISPKVAYKKFRKLFKQELKIDYDASGRACICQTKNCEELFEKLKKASSSTEYAGHGYHGHEWYGD